MAKTTELSAPRPEGSGEKGSVITMSAREIQVESPLVVNESTKLLLLRHKSALLWSCFMALGAVNWGLDILLSNSVIAVPSFKHDFGYLFKDAYIISASWQIAFNTASSVAMFFGAIASGFVTDRVGKLRTMQLACLISITAVLIQVLAKAKGVLLLGKLINGFALAAFLTIPSGYAAEVCPATLRGFSTSGVQFGIAFGQLLANVLIKATGELSSELAYRIPFALQFVLPVVLLAGLPFCPESPWYLLHRHKYDEVAKTLDSLGYPLPAITAADMSRTLERETQERARSTYLDCFRGSDLRRTEIAMGVFATGQLTGVVFVIGYSSYFFQLAGLSDSASFSLSVGVSVLALAGVVCSWLVLNRVGRRPIFFYGVALLNTLLLLIGIFAVVPTDGRGPVYGQVACIIAFAFIYLFSPGSLGWTLYVEVPSTRLRSHTVGLGVVVQAVFTVVMNIAIPLLINPDAADLGGRIGFIFAGTTALAVLWAYFRVPETANRSFEEIDCLFERGVSARAFKGAVVRRG